VDIPNFKFNLGALLVFAILAILFQSWLIVLFAIGWCGGWFAYLLWIQDSV